MKHKLSSRLPALLALFALVFAAAPAAAQKPRYTLTATEHFDKKTGTSTYKQTLRDRRTGRIFWVRHFSEVGNILWSKDRRAVAFTVHATPQERVRYPFGLKIGVWAAGKPVQTFFPNPEVEDDYIESMFWSPDDKYLLLKTGTSGDNDMGHGALWCVNTTTRRSLRIASKVRRVQWMSKRSGLYWDVYLAHGSSGLAVSEEERHVPRLWRLPKGF